jgi:hypothetical protein
MLSKKRKQEQNQAQLKAIQWLKNHDFRKKFFTFADVDKKFGLYLGFCYRNLKDYFPIGANEQYDDLKNNTKYYTQRGIAQLLKIDENRTIQILKNKQIPYITIYHKSSKITPKKFYHLSTIIKYFPDDCQFIHQSLQKTIISKSIALTKPHKFNIYQYYVFCSLVLFKIKNHYWPELQQIQSFLKNNFDLNYSISSISHAIDMFLQNGFLKKIKLHKNNGWIYFIYKGPLFLTHKQVKCLDPATKKLKTMFAPRDFYKGIVEEEIL